MASDPIPAYRVAIPFDGIVLRAYSRAIGAIGLHRTPTAAVMGRTCALLDRMPFSLYLVAPLPGAPRRPSRQMTRLAAFQGPKSDLEGSPHIHCQGRSSSQLGATGTTPSSIPTRGKTPRRALRRRT